MRKGQLHAVGAGAGLEWKEGSESLRLNTDPELAARISGDRIVAYNCDFTKQIPNKNIITAIPKSKITQIIIADTSLPALAIK